jgi:hypothetical protein
MIKLIEWARMRFMSSRDKADINTETTFTEQRKSKEPKPIGIPKGEDSGFKKMGKFVNIDWSKDANKNKK